MIKFPLSVISLLQYFAFKTALVCFVLLIVLYAVETQAKLPKIQLTDSPLNNSYTNDDVVKPTTGQNLSKEIKRGEICSYQISLSKGQYFYSDFIPFGFEARVTLQSADSEKLSIVVPESVSAPVAFLSATSNLYRLTIQANDEKAAGYFELFVRESRPSELYDKTRLLAEQQLFQGKQAIQKWTYGSFQSAIKSYTKAMRLWRSIRDKRGETKTYLAFGKIYLLTNNTVMAIQSYNAALLASQKSKLVSQEADSYNGLCRAFIAIGENQKGLEYGQRGVELSRGISYRYGEAEALNNLGQVYWAFSNMPKARESYYKSLETWKELKSSRGEAETLLNLSYVEFEQGNTQQAFDNSKEALTLSREVNDIWIEAYTLNAIGVFYFRSGDKQKSINYHNHATLLFQRMKDQYGEANSIASLAAIHGWMGNDNQALEGFRQALRLFRKLRSPFNEAIELFEIANLLVKKNDYKQAIEHLQLALDITRRISDPLLEALTLKTIGTVYKTIGKHKQALDYYKLALKRKPPETDIFNEANMLSEIGDVYQVLGKEHFDEAQDSFQKALALSRKIKDISSESQTLYRFARLERERGNLDKAKEYIEASLNLSDTLRSQFTNQDFRSLYFASAHDLQELYIDVLMRLDKERPNAGFAEAAFEASERGRARSLLEMLSESRIVVRADADASLLAKEQKLQKQLREQTEKQIRLLSGKHTTEESGTLAKEIESTLAEYKELQNRIRLSSPRYASLTQPRPLSLKEIQQQLLDDETQLLEFSLGEERSFLWVVSKNSVESFELPKDKVIEESVKKTLGLLIEESEQTRALRNSKESIAIGSSQSKFETESLKLSQMLFAQAQSSLKAKRLLIVSDGALQNLPFGALPIESPNANGGQKTGDSVQLLISNYEIINLPSASTLAALRQDERENKKHINSVAVFADPVFSKDDERLLSNSVASNKKKSQRKIATSRSSTLRALYESVRASSNKTSMKRSGLEIPRLPYSRGEAYAVASMLPSENVFLAIDFKADLNAATNPKLADYDIVHFATHGFLNNEQPELSGVMFSRFNERGEVQNGFLSLQEIYNLRLPVELVVLSACETGLGKELKGEGILGLTRGFMYAGAKRVIASLWKVDDVATAELMKLFYQKLLKENLSPTAALHVAQIEMQKQKRWKSPYYWAAFQIQGEWK